MEFSERYLKMQQFIKNLQNKICFKLEEIDGAKFIEDNWQHNESGGGKTRVIQNGNVIEKCGVNISSIKSEMSEDV
ncbi:MAG: coproporphyrinogen III oxidase, partial [Ignavibacteriaceae bacterium]